MGEFIRLVLVMGVNPSSAAGTAHVHNKPLEPGDKALALGGNTELVISLHKREFYKL